MNLKQILLLTLIFSVTTNSWAMKGLDVVEVKVVDGAAKIESERNMEENEKKERYGEKGKQTDTQKFNERIDRRTRTYGQTSKVLVNARTSLGASDAVAMDNDAAPTIAERFKEAKRSLENVDAINKKDGWFKRNTSSRDSRINDLVDKANKADIGKREKLLQDARDLFDDKGDKKVSEKTIQKLQQEKAHSAAEAKINGHIDTFNKDGGNAKDRTDNYLDAKSEFEKNKDTMSKSQRKRLQTKLNAADKDVGSAASHLTDIGVDHTSPEKKIMSKEDAEKSSSFWDKRRKPEQRVSRRLSSIESESDPAKREKLLKQAESLSVKDVTNNDDQGDLLSKETRTKLNKARNNFNREQRINKHLENYNNTRLSFDDRAQSYMNAKGEAHDNDAMDKKSKKRIKEALKEADKNLRSVQVGHSIEPAIDAHLKEYEKRAKTLNSDSSGGQADYASQSYRDAGDLIKSNAKHMSDKDQLALHNKISNENENIIARVFPHDAGGGDADAKVVAGAKAAKTPGADVNPDNAGDGDAEGAEVAKTPGADVKPDDAGAKVAKTPGADVKPDDAGAKVAKTLEQREANIKKHLSDFNNRSRSFADRLKSHSQATAEFNDGDGMDKPMKKRVKTLLNDSSYDFKSAQFGRSIEPEINKHLAEYKDLQDTLTQYVTGDDFRKAREPYEKIIKLVDKYLREGTMNQKDRDMVLKKGKYVEEQSIKKYEKEAAKRSKEREQRINNHLHDFNDRSRSFADRLKSHDKAKKELYDEELNDKEDMDETSKKAVEEALKEADKNLRSVQVGHSIEPAIDAHLKEYEKRAKTLNSDSSGDTVNKASQPYADAVELIKSNAKHMSDKDKLALYDKINNEHSKIIARVFPT